MSYSDIILSSFIDSNRGKTMVDVKKLRQQLPQNWVAMPIPEAMHGLYQQLRSLIEREVKMKQRFSQWLAQPLVEDTMGILSEALAGECLFSRKPTSEEFQRVKQDLENRLAEAVSATNDLRARLETAEVYPHLTLGLNTDATLNQVNSAYTLASTELTSYLDKNCLTPLVSLEADEKTGTPEWVALKTEELWTRIKLMRLREAYRVLSS